MTWPRSDSGRAASGDFSTLYTQFIPSAPAFGLKIDRSIMGALNVDFQQAMQTIAVLAGGNYSGLTYESGQVRNIYVQADAENRRDLDDVLSYYVRSETASWCRCLSSPADLTSAPPVISHYNLYRTILIQGAEAVGKSSGQALTRFRRSSRPRTSTTSATPSPALRHCSSPPVMPVCWCLVLGILIVYLVLSAQYESYVTPSDHPDDRAPGHARGPGLSGPPLD